MSLNDVLDKLTTNAESSRVAEEQKREQEDRAELKRKALELDATKLVQRFFRPLIEKALPKLQQIGLEPKLEEKTNYNRRRETSPLQREFFSLSFTPSVKPENSNNPYARPRGIITAFHECETNKIGVYVEFQGVAQSHHRPFIKSVTFDEINDDVADLLISDAIAHIG
jgi:hypothetical protein